MNKSTFVLIIIAVVSMISFGSTLYMNPFAQQKAQTKAELDVVSSIITTDITTIEELQSAITENEGLLSGKAVVVGKGYAVMIENKAITSILPIAKHIEAKQNQAKQNENVGSVGAEP